MKTMLNISSQMPTQMQLSLLNERGSDLHTGLSCVFSSKPSDGQWMDKNLIFKEEQEASVTTQSEDKDGVNQCSICLKKFAYPSKLARHILSHTNIRPFKCHMCVKSFQFQWHLQCHMRIHKKKGRNIIAGPLDQDGTVSFSNARKSKEQDVHISSQGRAEDSATDCKDQNMVLQKVSGDSHVYVQDTLLNERDLDFHTGQSSACSSEPSDGLWMDKNQESEEEQQASVATQSEDNDVNAKVLQNKSRNGNKRVYKCPVCLKGFGAPSKLKRHCLIHTDQRPFQCSICFRGFRERSHLKTHLRTHTNHTSSDAVTSAGKRNFPVSKSSDRICTRRHKKKSGYQCEICLKNFSFPSKLTRHLFVHFDVKAYTCTICKKSFKQAYYLHKHLKLHKNYNSRLCRVPQKHETKPTTSKALKGTNNCKLDEGNVCLPQILDSLEAKKQPKLECQSKLNQNIQLIESNSSTAEIKSSDALKNTEEQIAASRPIYLKHKEKGVNQCSICLKNFVYPSKLARHILSHTDSRPFKCHICLKSFQFQWHLQCHVRIHKKKGRYIIAGHLEEDRTVSFCNAVKSKEQDVHISSQERDEVSATVHKDHNMVKDNMVYQKDDTRSTDKEKSTEHHDQVMVIENMASPKMSGDSSDSDVYLHEILLNEGDLDVHTGQSSPYFSKHSDGQWIEKKLIFKDEKEASVTTQSEDKDCVNQCSICLKKFAYPSKLARHILSHTNIRPFKCHLCLKSFQFRWHLQCHVRIHKKKGRNIIASHLEEDHTVSFSNAGKSKEQDVHTSSQDRAEDSATVHQDQKMVKENIVYQKMMSDFSNSNVCLKDTLLNEGDLHLHTGQSSAYSSKPSDGQWMEKNLIFEEEQEVSVTTQSEDNDVNAKLLQSESCNRNKRVYECPVCLKRFGAPSKLKRHCLIHTDQRPFQCSICFRGFRERSHLKAHLRIHTNPLSPNAVTLAGKGVFPVSKSSDRQCMLHRKKKSGYQCEICLKNFSFPSKLTRHLFVHFDDKAYTCTICRKSFKQACYLHKHLKVHTGKINSNSRLCKVPQKHRAQSLTPGAGSCNVHLPQILDCLETKKYEKPESRSKLSQNVQLIESNLNIVEIKSSLKCAEEQITTSSPTHLKYKQKGVNQCSICLKSFAYPSKLARHILSHTDIRPFKCHVCLKSFKFLWHLQCHVRVHKKKSRNIIAVYSELDHTVSVSNARMSKEQDMQISPRDGAEDPAIIHQDQNMIMESQKICGDSSDSLLNERGLDLHIGQSYAYSSKPSEGPWINKIQQIKEEEEASDTIQSKDTDVNANVFQSDNRIENRNKRMYGCPVCHKRFGAPSKLKRHCRIHTNQRPFQCSICCRAFRERSHLKVHIRIHNITVKPRTTTLQSYKDNSLPCNQASKSFPKQLTVQDDEKSTVHQDQNMMITGNMASQKMSGDSSNSGAYLQDSLPNEGGLDLYTGQCFAYSSKPLIGHGMKEKLKSEDEQEASVTTQSEGNNINPKNSNGNKIVYDCPVCYKQFGAPSKLKRHCLIHTNQRPFKCSICCRAFRERSHLKVHIRTHTKPLKLRISSLQNYRDNSVPCNQASKSKLKLSPKEVTAQDDTSSTDKQKSVVHQDQKMVTENMASQSASGDCNDSDVCLQDSLLNKGGLDLHSGQSSAYSSKPSKGQWMKEIQESDEEQEASSTTQSDDMDVNVKVLQNNNSKRNKRVYDCPVCHKRFGAPSKLKRHSLIHTNQRPFQCSICCSAFRERSHLKVHLRTHTKPVKRRASSLPSYRDDSFPCTRASKSRLKPFAKQQTAQKDTSSTDKQTASVHQDLNMVTENMASQKMSGHCCDSGVCLQDFLLNEEGLDLHSGQSSAYSSKASVSQWKEEIQKSEEEQEANVATQSDDKDGNPKVLQSVRSNRSKRAYECPVCHKQFGAPSKLKRHCLIHTNQRPFQCSICSSAFRERSHLKVHLRTHTKPGKQRTKSLQSYRDNSLPFTRASKSRLKPSPKQPTAQDNTRSTDKDKSTVHHDQIMVTENMASPKTSSDCSYSDVYLQDSLLNDGVDLNTGQSSICSSKPSEGQWMEEIQKSEEEQEASGATQSDDKDGHPQVWQSKSSNRSKRVHECPVCHKRFGAPSKLKRHCLIHTNQRPFQCSICSSAFRERSHLKVHLRTHTKPGKLRTKSLQSYRDNSLPCTRTSKSRLKPSPKQLTALNNTSSKDKQNLSLHQDLSMVTENRTSQKMSGDCRNSFVFLQDSLLNEGGLDLNSRQSSVDFSKTSEGQWKEEIQESEEEQKASVTTHSEDMDVNVKVLQSKNSNRSKRVYECHVCHKRFGAPSKLKRHCLIHTNQRPFQCSICCCAFRERSRLKAHFRTMHQDQNMVTEDMLSQKISDSDLYFSKSTSPLENVENKSNVFQCNNKSVWSLMHKKTSDIVPFGRVSDCPPKTDSSLRHCASESRTEENWPHHIDDIEDCDFVDTGKLVPDSSLSTSGQYQQKSDVPTLPEVVVELEDFDDQGECFPNPPNDLPVCPDCSQCFPTVRDLYAHNCANRYPEVKMKKSHQCDICLKFFSAPSKLKRHWVTHTGQRPFKCTQCQKSFTQPHHLKTHIQSHR